MPAGGDDVRFKADLINGEAIASIEGSEEYLVPSGSDDVPVNVKIQIPENANLESSYEVAVSFQEISTGEGGMIHIATGFTTSFPVQVVTEEESGLFKQQPEQKSNLFWIALVVLVAVAIAVVYSIKHKKE